MIAATFHALTRDSSGSMAIETAFVAPLLAILALGGFEVGTMVSRHHELQTAAAEGEVIALATNGGAEVEISTIEDIIATSLDLDASNVEVSRMLRCNANDELVLPPNPCDEDDTVSQYIQIEVTETYTPVWTTFGVGGPVDLAVERTVQIS